MIRELGSFQDAYVDIFKGYNCYCMLSLRGNQGGLMAKMAPRFVIYKDCV